MPYIIMFYVILGFSSMKLRKNYRLLGSSHRGYLERQLIYSVVRGKFDIGVATVYSEDGL